MAYGQICWELQVGVPAWAVWKRKRRARPGPKGAECLQFEGCGRGLLIEDTLSPMIKLQTFVVS